MEIIRGKTIAFTGNRNLTSHRYEHEPSVRINLFDHLFIILEKEYLENGYDTFLCGMALGFDTVAALASLHLREKYKDIRFIAVVPFENQEAKFPEVDKILYANFIAIADSIIVINDKGYSNEAYHERNDFLIANSSKIIAYHNGKLRSGAGSTIRKALAQGVEVENVYLTL